MTKTKKTTKKQSTLKPCVGTVNYPRNHAVPDDEDDTDDGFTGKDVVISSLKLKIVALEAESAVKEALLDKFIDKLMDAAIEGR